MISLIFLCLILHSGKSISVGMIDDVYLVLPISSISIEIEGTSIECICTMLGSSNISALNSFSNNTCQLFSNVSLTNTYYSLISSAISRFYFLQLPTKAVITTTQQTNIVTSLSTNRNPTSMTSTNVGTMVVVTVAGTGIGGSTMNQLNAPNDIYVNANGTLYVADYYNLRIQIFLPSNRTASFSQRGMGNPNSVYVDNTSNYYATEGTSGINRLSKWPLNQTILTGYMAYGIAMDSQRNFYVSTLENVILFFNRTSNTNTTIVSTSRGLNGSRHICLDERNADLYIADASNNRIVKFHLGRGNLTVVAGGHGRGNHSNQLNFPAGVCISQRHGTIYVADTNNNRIQKWSVNETIGVTILGNTNGTADNGTYGLNNPYALFLDSTETYLYIADSGNNRIQRLTLN